MTRAMDLDTVAPDDVIEVKTDQNPPPTPSLDTPSQKASDVQSEMRGKENLINKNVKEEKNIINKKIDKVEKAKEIVKEIESPKKSNSDELRAKIYAIAGHTKHSLSSMLVRPDVFNFQERDVDEEIILVARPHWFTNVSWIITTIFLIIAPSLLKFIPLISDIPGKYQFIGILLWYLVTFAFAFEKFLSWYFDVYIITDERVIDIEFNNMLDKKFSEAKISMIQDTTSRVSGVSQTLFNYGTVFIQTAAEVPELNFEKVPNPDKIIKILQILREEEELEAIEGRVR